MPELPTAPATVQVAVETPQHAGLADALDYQSEQALAPGTLVRVPLGKREVPGIVWPAQLANGSDPAPIELKKVIQAVTALPPLGARWCELIAFTASYYQRGLGEVALSVLPPELRKLDNAQIANRIGKLHKALVASNATAVETELPALSADQSGVLKRLNDAPPNATSLLFGITGSGKTEVYLRAAASALAAGKQALVLVPEINLTPQLEARFAERFQGRHIVSLHSGLTPAQRLRSWLAAHLGLADLVLGTRLAVFASMPRLGLIVVDEEHDPSYKQQDGARYSAVC